MTVLRLSSIQPLMQAHSMSGHLCSMVLALSLSTTTPSWILTFLRKLFTATRCHYPIDHSAIFHQYAFIIGSALSKLKYLVCGGEQGLVEAFAEILRHGGPCSCSQYLWTHGDDCDCHDVRGDK